MSFFLRRFHLKFCLLEFIFVFRLTVKYCSSFYFLFFHRTRELLVTFFDTLGRSYLYVILRIENIPFRIFYFIYVTKLTLTGFFSYQIFTVLLCIQIAWKTSTFLTWMVYFSALIGSLHKQNICISDFSSENNCS